MERDREQEHDNLRVLIEQMQRAGHSEKEIHSAVREASTDRGPERQGSPRRPRRFGIFGRRSSR